jgi:hypothetical protein
VESLELDKILQEELLFSFKDSSEQKKLDD